MRRCYCRSCRTRDERAFWTIIHANDPSGCWEALTERVAPEPATLVARIGRYGMPPIPEWHGGPRELFDGGGTA